MKKTNIFVRLIKTIVKFFDKKIILPITKIVVFISNKFNSNERSFERILTKKSGLIIISLLVAIGLFFVADTKSTSLVETYAEVLYDQPISAAYNEEAYVVEGLPETVDITLIGRKSDVYLAKQLPINDISVDLTGLTAGVHKVNLKYKKALSSVEYKLDPSVATIVIYEKVSAEKEINYEIINKDKIDSKLMIDTVSLNTDKVYVKGNESTLKDVAVVKALVDLKNLIDAAPGEQTIKDIKLAAYDSDGKKMDVELVPSKIEAVVKITSPQKEVPIKLIPKNYDIFDKAISTMDSDVKKVMIYGDQEKLDKITYIPVEVDVTNLKEDKKISSKIEKPTGVRTMSASSINVTVAVGNASHKEINDIYLEYENLDSNFIVQAVNRDETKVTVNVSGVQSTLNSLDPTTIKAYVDLKEITEPGDYEVPVQVKGNDLTLKYKAKTTKITLRISKKN